MRRQVSRGSRSNLACRATHGGVGYAIGPEGIPHLPLEDPRGSSKWSGISCSASGHRASACKWGSDLLGLEGRAVLAWVFDADAPKPVGNRLTKTDSAGAFWAVQRHTRVQRGEHAAHPEREPLHQRQERQHADRRRKNRGAPRQAGTGRTGSPSACIMVPQRRTPMARTASAAARCRGAPPRTSCSMGTALRAP
jgi:hypothetical protein